MPDTFFGHRAADPRRRCALDLRAEAIAEFNALQVREKRWVSLDDVAATIAQRDFALPATAVAEKKREALLNFLRAAVAGRLPRLFLAHVGYRLSRRWLADPDSAPAVAFVTPSRLNQWIEVSDEAAIAGEIIPKCYVPRETAVELLNSQPGLLPPWARDTITGTRFDADIVQSESATALRAAHPPKPLATKAKRGAKPKYDWPGIEQFVTQLMTERGEFIEWDAGSGWQSKADLERAVLDYVVNRLKQDEPATSTLRDRVTAMLARWRASQAAS